MATTAAKKKAAKPTKEVNLGAKLQRGDIVAYHRRKIAELKKSVDANPYQVAALAVHEETIKFLMGAPKRAAKRPGGKGAK